MSQPSLKRPCPADDVDGDEEKLALTSSGHRGAKRARTTSAEGEQPTDAGLRQPPPRVIPLVVLTRELTPWLWARVRRLVETGGFDAHVVQDTALPHKPKESSFFFEAMAMGRLHFAPDDELEAAGYRDINKHVTRKSFTAWERGVYWAALKGKAATPSEASTAAGTGAGVEDENASAAPASEAPSSANAWSDRVFFAEDDAQWCDPVSFGAFCRYVMDESRRPALDLLAERLYNSPAENPAWPHWGKGFHYFKRDHLSSAFVPFCCMSQRLLSRVKDFAAKHKTLCFLEVLFASLAKEGGLNVGWFSELSTGAAAGSVNPVASRWRPDYEDSDLQRMLQGHRCPEPPSFHSSLIADTTGELQQLPAYPVLFHPIKRECAFWAEVWEKGEVVPAPSPTLPAPASSPSGSAATEAGKQPEASQQVAKPAATGSTGTATSAALRAVVAAVSYDDI